MNGGSPSPAHRPVPPIPAKLREEAREPVEIEAPVCDRFMDVMTASLEALLIERMLQASRTLAEQNDKPLQTEY